MIKIAEAINSFASQAMQTNLVPPSEEPIFILSSGQLTGIISEAVNLALENELELKEALSEAKKSLEKLLEVVKTQSSEIQALKSILEAQNERLENLEGIQELYHGKAPAREDRPILREVWERKREIQDGIPSRVWGIEQDLQSLEEEVQSLKEKDAQVLGEGRKTQARIKKLKQILKASGGSSTFGELEKALGLSPSQFSKLLNHLDKRVFEIGRRPGGKRGEKILSLRVRISELV
jgi:chromosome segregation ATPase